MSFPANLGDLQNYISGLVNDPTNTRYSLAMINSQLDLAQHRWNMEAKIVRWTDFIPCYANQSRYFLTALNLTPIQILRATWKGVALQIRSKQYFDQYSAIDWQSQTGTPKDICIDLNSNTQVGYVAGVGASLILRPIPQAGDVTSYYYSGYGPNANSNLNPNGYPLSVEYLAPHIQLSASTDVPFTPNISSLYVNNAILPFLAGLGLDVAASILEPDPTAETVSKAKIFRAQANAYLSLVVQMYQGLEEDVPGRMQGGRAWIMGSSGNVAP